MTVALTADAVTQTFAILGQRGTGKTNKATAHVEDMVDLGGYVVILDPVGAWYGITRGGSGAGLPGIVIGGEHGDVPLEETAGLVLSDFITERHYQVVVIDMKLLRKGAQLRLLADFCENLFHKNREALHVVFEEADRAAPQQIRVNDINASRLLGAVEDIVKLGRSRGLGATLITQRPATLNKNVLEVCENLVLFRLMGPNDQKAARAWVAANGDDDKLKEVMSSLASLKRGEHWFWSPAWLEVLERTKARHRRTFDSSGTPEVGQVAAKPTERAPVDLDALRARMAETIEKAKQDNPQVLRDEIARLKKELIHANLHPVPPAIDAEYQRMQAERDRLRDELEAERRESNRVYEQFITNRDRLAGQVSTLIYSLSFVEEHIDATGTQSPGRDGRIETPKRSNEPAVRPASRGIAAVGGTAERGDNPADQGVAGLPAQPRPRSLGQNRPAAETRPGGRTPANPGRPGLSGRDTEDMKDEDVEKLVQRYVIAQGGRVEVPPAEVIRQEYQRAAVVRILEKVDVLLDEERQALRFLLGQEMAVTAARLTQGLTGTTAGQVIKRWTEVLNRLTSQGFCSRGGAAGGGNAFKPRLREMVASDLSPHTPMDEEVEQVYQAVLARIAGAA